MDRILRILDEAGQDAETRARQFRTLSYYIMEAGVDEALGHAHGPSAVEPVPQDEAQRDFPAIMAVGKYFGDDYHQEIFEYGVDVLLDRFEAVARSAPGRG